MLVGGWGALRPCHPALQSRCEGPWHQCVCEELGRVGQKAHGRCRTSGPSRFKLPVLCFQVAAPQFKLCCIGTPEPRNTHNLMQSLHGRIWSESFSTTTWMWTRWQGCLPHTGRSLAKSWNRWVCVLKGSESDSDRSVHRDTSHPEAISQAEEKTFFFGQDLPVVSPSCCARPLPKPAE